MSNTEVTDTWIVRRRRARVQPDRLRLRPRGPALRLSADAERAHRIRRLARTIDVALRMMMPGWRHTYARAFTLLATRLVGVDDHEGLLTARWRDEPTVGEQRLLSRAWAAVGEDELHVRHVWPGGRLDPPVVTYRRGPHGWTTTIGGEG